MNLKYYLRGLGIGIIVTAIIMGIAVGRSKETLSDSEIIERAKALGMVEESTRLADAGLSPGPGETGLAETSALPTTEPAIEPETKETPEPTKEPTPEPTSEAEAEPEVTAAPEADATPTEAPEADAAPAATPEPTSDTAPAPAITIRVNSGDASDTVSQKLEEAGLVTSASEFDRLLYEKGYDKRIKIGTFEIPVGADAEQIAGILTGIN